ncbi:rhodanese-like domain-containing protein [Salirhabdus salicampi]|uniref:rhodanese-like domain-containing protein n=1 Tax=Salirhabdus salicampi TaxID=476102 RepID=UPI0020C35E59|nr:rhodanese-like domain-containing protein [Salirhabdus salicampi]MCP8616266.1 rhodanese-like domain-containing protein [Salirhabdus salicampi]
MAYENEGVIQIDVDELKEALRDDETIVIDIREHEEYVAGHIPGLPLIPMSEIVDVVDEFEKDRSYVLVCRSGRRSHETSKFFQMNGIKNVKNYAGGMLVWDGEIAVGEENIVKEVKEIY